MRYRLERKMKGQYCVVTSPEVEGLCAISDTFEQAEKEALELIKLVQKLDGNDVVVTAVEMEVAA